MHGWCQLAIVLEGRNAWHKYLTVSVYLCLSFYSIQDTISILTHNGETRGFAVRGTGPMPYYNVLDFVRLRSELPLRELERFRSNHVGREDVVIRRYTDFHAKPRFDRRVLVGKGGLSYVEHPGFLGATVRIKSGDPVVIEVSWLFKYSNAVLYVNVVEPILRLLMARKGLALVHGACLSRKEKAILVSAPPDTGKTTTVLRCLNKGWFSFLSDDMTVVGPKQIVHSFPKPFTISAHTYASMIRNDLRLKSFKREVKLRVKSLVHSRTGRNVLRLVGKLNVPILTLNAIGQIVVKPPKVFVEDLVRGVTTRPQAQAVAVCILRKGGEKIIPIPPEKALLELLANSEDAFGFPPYSELFRYLTLYGRGTHEILAQEKSLLSDLVSSVQCFALYSSSRRWDLQLNTVMDQIVRPTPIVPPVEAPVPSATLPFRFTQEPLVRP